jgi:hypothetical protein
MTQRDAPEQDARYVVCCPDSSKVKFEIAGASLLHVVSANMQRGASETLRSQISALIAEHCGDKKGSVAQLKKQREREVTAPSLHGLGIVVPVNTKTETGFRELPVTGSDLAALLENVRVDPSDARSRGRVNELLTRATIASDECDFGTGLLLGLDLLTAGSCFQVGSGCGCGCESGADIAILTLVRTEGGDAAPARGVRPAAARRVLQDRQGPILSAIKAQAITTIAWTNGTHQWIDESLNALVVSQQLVSPLRLRCFPFQLQHVALP